MTKISSVKQLVESGCVKSVPLPYVFPRNHDYNNAIVSDEEEEIPIIDFSLLASGNPDQRSKVIKDLGNACREWGFFMVIYNIKNIYFTLFLEVS